MVIVVRTNQELLVLSFVVRRAKRLLHKVRDGRHGEQSFFKSVLCAKLQQQDGGCRDDATVPIERSSSDRYYGKRRSDRPFSFTLSPTACRYGTSIGTTG
jgi:hypothetical protein